MARKHANRVLVETATTGTGTMSLGAAVPGYQSFASAGVADADTVRYLLIDGNSFEIGIGTYTSAGPTLSRDTVEESTETANAKLDLTGGGKVAIIASAADYAGYVSGPSSTTDNHVAVYDGETGRLLKAVAALPVAQGGTGGTDAPTARDGLDLGTAATADQTTSATDTTAGRLLRVGAGHQQLDATIYRRGNILGTVSQSGGVPTGAVIQRGSNANGAFTRWADGTQICRHEFNAGSATHAGSGTFADPYSTSAHTWSFPAAFAAAPTLALSARLADGSIPVVNRVFAFGFAGASPDNVTAIRAQRANAANASGDVIVHAQAIGRWF